MRSSMPCTRFLLAGLVIASAIPALRADDKAELAKLLGREIIGPQRTLAEVQDFCEALVPRVPKVANAAEWQRLAERWRADALAHAVYRGEAAAWRDAKTKVEWLDTLPGGPGYHL